MNTFCFLLHFLAIVCMVSGFEEESFYEWQKRTIKIFEKNTEKYLVNSRKSGPSFFDVEFEADPEPTSVHALRPQDIDVVGAMGDSISAGVGAENGVIAVEARGNVFSAGGEGTIEDMITLPNILKHFNRYIDGYSVGTTFDPYENALNVAVSGARAYNMPSQATRLLDRIKTDNRTNFERDWKLITLFIGGNDLCAIGRDPVGASPESYVAGIREGLDILHAELPRAFINVVDIMEIYVLPEVRDSPGGTLVCKAISKTFCGYVVTAGDSEMQNIKEINKEYQVQFQALIDSGRYDTRDDFTVVIQPFLRDTVLPYTENGDVDASYFANDCFHFSEIAHAMCALNLFNNMLEPVGQKSTVWTISNIKVPTEEHPYFYTNKNSPSILSESSSDCPAIEQTNETPTWAVASIISLIVLNLLALAAITYLVSKRKKIKVSEENKHFEASNEAFDRTTSVQF